VRNDRILSIASATLRIVNGLNWAFVAGFIVALLMSFVFRDALATHLAAKYHGRNVAETIFTMRMLVLLGISAGIALHQIFSRLHAIVATVRAGDPFVAANADRLQRIGWALLALQLLDLALGGIAVVFDRLGVDHATWTLGFTGWIAVLMIFVLARVFHVGAVMRDDLAMTV
jgi:hypothetical protein